MFPSIKMDDHVHQFAGSICTLQIHDLMPSARKRRRHAGTHQILNLTLKHGVHANDEGSGRTQHLQQPWGQNRDVRVAAHHTQWAELILEKQARMSKCMTASSKSLFSSTAHYLDCIWLWNLFKESLKPLGMFLQLLTLKTTLFFFYFKIHQRVTINKKKVSAGMNNI